MASRAHRSLTRNPVERARHPVPPDSAGERLDDLAASFRGSLRADGKADRTATLYDMSVPFYAEWLTGQGRPGPLDQLTRSAIREQLCELLTRNAVDPGSPQAA